MCSYDVCVFIGALGGSFTLRAILNLAITSLQNANKITVVTARWLRYYTTVKAIATPLVFFLISTSCKLHTTVDSSAHVLIDKILLNFNGGSALLTPERHITSLLIHKGVWLWP